MTVALEQLAAFLQRATGIRTRREQLPSLAAAVARVAPGATPEALLHELGQWQQDPATIDRLIDETTVRETFFFRQRRELDAIDWLHVRRAAVAAGSQEIRVWIAACASGEEAYSIAILAREALAGRPFPVRIVATDISSRALAEARAGAYGERATRNLDAATRERYFHRDGDRLVVTDDLRRDVEFARHNLTADPLPPPGEQLFHVILCRNVLIYFDEPTVEQVVAGLERALAPGGTLVLGAADRLCGVPRRRPQLARPDGVLERRRVRAAKPRDSARPEAASVMPAAQPDPPRRRLADALAAADRGELDLARSIADRALHDDPLNPDAHFIRGMTELASGKATAAVESLRRALYTDPTFGLAAFKLGRAYDELGQPAAACRAYEQALRTLDPDDRRHREILDQVDLGDVAAACRMRLRPPPAGA